MFNDSEPNYEESAESHKLALKEGFSSFNTYEDGVGPGQHRDPVRRHRLLDQILRFDR